MLFYLWNTQLSQSLYIPLQFFEIALRNSTDVALSKLYGNDWYDPNFMSGKFHELQIERVQKVFDRSTEQKLTMTKDYMVANLSFGFWVDLFFHAQYEKLWQYSLHTAFPHKTKGTQRKHVAPRIKPVHILRNRIAHHEPICWSKPGLDDQHKELMELISWICPDTHSLVKHHDQFSSIWNNKPTVSTASATK